MRVFTKIIFLALCLSPDLTGLTAQNLSLSFKRYSTKEGLSSGIVYDIIKDSFGFLWIATEDGLNRFDGTNFKVYKHDPAKSGGLGVNHITSLYESREGCIWIGTNGGGLSCYDRGNDSIFTFKAKGPNQIGVAVTSVNGDKQGNVWITSYGGLYIINPINKQLVTVSKYDQLLKALQSKVSLSFFQDSKNNVWVGTNAGLYLYEPVQHRLQVFYHQEGDKTSIASNVVNKIAEDNNGTIWLATENGLASWSAGNIFRNCLQTSPLNRKGGNVVHTLGVDPKNRLWIGTDEGMNLMEIATGTVSNYIPDSRNPNSLSGHSVRSILIDKQGVYWLGTFMGGINKYDENLNYFNLKQSNAFDPYGLRSPVVTSFAQYQNSVFIGTDGGGLHVYHRNNGMLDHINLPLTIKSGNHDLSILALEMTRSTRLWIGTYMYGLYCYTPANDTYQYYAKGPDTTDLNNDAIFCLKEDRNRNIWIGTNGGGVNLLRPGSPHIIKYVADPAKLNDPTRPANNYIRSIEEDKTGRIWIGTFGGGVSVLDPVSQKFIFYTKENSGLPSNYVLSIKEDSKGNIWIGTSGNGIGLLKKNSKQFESLNEKDGLANGTIQKIVEDDFSKIWISTNNGLSCYDPQTGKFKNYSNYYGLQDGAFMLGAGIRLADGELFFGGQNGFNHFNPADLKTNTKSPQVVFTDLKVDNVLVVPSANGPIDRSLLLTREIHLKYKQNFSISFEALDFTIPEANLYDYQLKGVDQNWTRAGKEHSAYYANIAPGEYVFRVRASNNDGVWNQEGRSIKIIIASPFWRTNYAYATYILLFAGIILYMRHTGIKKIQRKFALEHERREAKQLIERERKEAEYLRKLDQMKIKFLTNLSHEFRTPISLIIGPVDSLIGQIKAEAPLNNLNLIKRNARRLLNLVNQLLDYGKMEEQELKLQCHEGDIVFFIKDVCDSFNDVARQKNISFNFYTEVVLLPLLFDHDKMERILFNILSNAFKFTPGNGHIAVTLEELDKEPGQDFSSIRISIADTGIGIPKDAQTRIFESFFQHDRNAEILNQGTGIGLSIAKEFVKMHGGFISVESEAGKGSTFTLHLTLRHPEKTDKKGCASRIETTQNSTPTVLSKNNPDKPSLLIVEDDDDFRFYIKENLMAAYRIYEAPNGKEGWQRTLFYHPDIIVCDIQMPVMNGLELVQKLKSDKRTRHIPVILLTAANTRYGVLDGLESGAIDYMTKPFDFTILEAKIHNILVLNQSFKETYSKQVTVGLPETGSVSDKDQFLKRTITFVYENLDNSQLSVEVLSTHLCISRASLYNRLLEYTGMSPVEFIRSIKLEKAKSLLEKGDMTVTEIAYETGFANPNYFAKVFKAKYNMPPTEFQEQQKK